MVKLGNSEIKISLMGMGCWAIGGKWSSPDGKPLGWGEVDDNESIRAIHAGLAAGINFIDTANVYGAGHSERVIARALKGRRDQVVLATKFGGNIDEKKKISLEQSAEPDSIRKSCDDSLKRLETDYIDLFQFHMGGYELDKAQEVMDVLEELVEKGKIRSYGWSTDDVERARFFARGKNCTAVQFQANVISQNPPMVKACEETGLTGINRGPLAMGLLSGKYKKGVSVGGGDIRGAGMAWMKFFNSDGTPNDDFLTRLEKIREILTHDGRSLVQGALGWLWASSSKMVPIPGFRTVAQIEENARAMEFGPLDRKKFDEIQRLLKVE
jgi:aryl-alcohol dehydrogenase-like predicted oxidoreductase